VEPRQFQSLHPDTGFSSVHELRINYSLFCLLSA
jgi:hypothetical protein